jgi:hypothetical protein
MQHPAKLILPDGERQLSNRERRPMRGGIVYIQYVTIGEGAVEGGQLAENHTHALRTFGALCEGRLSRGWS